MAGSDPEKDIEASKPTRLSYWQVVFNQQAVTPEVINHKYPGSGTEEDPYVVNWIEDDPRNPMLWPTWLKWVLSQVVAIATLAVAFVSSAYSGGVQQIIMQFHTSSEIVVLGISLFVLGFALGPLIWAPMSELYGRQYLFIGTYLMLTIFNAAAAGSQNIQTLIVLRFFAGAFGSSPLTNAGGVIADIFPATQRGLAMSLFAAAPFLGPVIGPIVGGFAGQSIGWRWVEGIMAIFTGVLWIVGIFALPETYPPVLLRQRAKKLSKLSGKVYVSQGDATQGKVSPAQAFKTSLMRPWILLFREPIVLLLTIYMAIIYGTLYMMFSAFPIVFQEYRGWSEGIGGLAFIGVAVGMIGAVIYSIFDNKRYIRLTEKSPDGVAPPESRLPPCMVGGLCLPVGLIIFAWTDYPSIHWIVPIMAAAPFGFGMVLVFLSIMNYLIDSYVIYAASVLAANSVLRSCFGAAFPLFTTYMYDNLGIHWATMVPAFLALACTPFPFLFYKYGSAIRKRCKFAAEAAAFMEEMRGNNNKQQEDNSLSHEDGSENDTASIDDGAVAKEKDIEHDRQPQRVAREREQETEQEAVDYSYDEPAQRDGTTDAQASRFRSIRATTGGPLTRTGTNTSVVSVRSFYEHSPFDIDRVNTRDSFRGRSSTDKPVKGSVQRLAANNGIAAGSGNGGSGIFSSNGVFLGRGKANGVQGVVPNEVQPTPVLYEEGPSRPQSIKSGKSGLFY